MSNIMGTGVRCILVYGMSDNPGGIETYLLNLVKATRNRNIRFDFVTDFPKIAYKEELLNAGGKVYYIPAKSNGVFQQWRALRKILKEHPEYSSVYFNVLNAGAVFTMAVPWCMRRKIIVHSHNGSADNIRLHNLCRPFMVAMSREFISCSRLAAEFMFGKKAAKKRNVLIIPNAIDAVKYDFQKSIRDEERKKLEIENKFVLCHIGRIVYQKNPIGVVDILKQCQKSLKDVILLWAGEGDMKKEVEEYAKEQGVFEQIRFLGVRKDIYKLLQAADCFILPSIYEGLPIVAIEAQAAGLPCLLSDRITQETKITQLAEFLPINDLKMWERAIIRSKSCTRISRKKEIIDAGYDLRHQEENINKLLQKIL